MRCLLLTLATAMLAVAPLQAAPRGDDPTPPAAPDAPPAAPAPAPSAPPARGVPDPVPHAVELGRPQPLKVALVNGSTAVGQVARWDVEGIDATIGGAARRIRWDDIVPTDLYRLRKRLIEQIPQVARREAMLELAAYLYSRPDADDLGNRAFDDAKRWGADADEREAIRDRGEALRQARNERLGRADRARLAEGSPEAAMFGNLAWPPRTAEEQAAALAQLRKQAIEMLATAGRDSTPVESTHCLVYSTLGVSDSARRATEIDAFIAASLPRLGLPKETVLWEGRLVVIVSEDRDRFALLEAAAFKSQPRPDEVAIAHYDGPFAYVHLLKQADEVGAQITTFRAVALAILHRFVSSTRPPAWANEGFADWLVAMYPPTKRLDAALRRVGLASVRSANGFARTISFAYEPMGWPFRDASGRAESYILVSFLAERQPEAFLAFLKTVKGGEPWRGAITTAFKAPIERLIEAAWEFHRTND
jgi:hypothetical protein